MRFQKMEKSQNLDTKSKIRSIHEAGLGRRLIAMIMDAAIFAFVTVALALWVFSPIVNSTMKYDELGAEALRYELFSNLYVLEVVNDEDQSKTVVDIPQINEAQGTSSVTPLYDYVTEDIEFYKTRLHYYYCNYKTGVGVQVIEGHNPEEFKAPDHNILIKDNSGNDVLPKNYYTDEWFATLIEGKTTVDQFRNLSYNATKDMRDSSYFKTVNDKIGTCQLIMILPAFGISFLGFYLLVPLLYKNGETFGKKVMKIGFISNDGYDVKKRQIVFRQILLLAWVSLSMFIVGIGLTSLATLGVGVVIYLIATVISKTKRSPIDYAAYTYLIDTNGSVWFKDEKEEAKKEEELVEKMSKYRHYEPDKKNLIQVGTEIVNEDVKRELEEEKLKNPDK